MGNLIMSVILVSGIVLKLVIIYWLESLTVDREYHGKSHHVCDSGKWYSFEIGHNLLAGIFNGR
jgi:hypothetical protein